MIKDVRYFYENKIYRFNGELFNAGVVHAMVDHIQKRDYEQFAEEINRQGGWLEVHLSHLEHDKVRYDCRVVGISQSLEATIRQSLR